LSHLVSAIGSTLVAPFRPIEHVDDRCLEDVGDANLSSTFLNGCPSSKSVIIIDHIRHQHRTSKIEKKVKEGTNNESLLNEMKMQFQFQRL